MKIHAPNITGSLVGNISGSATSTGSFGHIMKSGVNWDTAVSASAATAGFGGGGGTITALNNATANELVTIGSTTTELDAESNLTFDGTTLVLSGSVSQRILSDTNVQLVLSSSDHNVWIRLDDDSSTNGNYIGAYGDKVTIWPNDTNIIEFTSTKISGSSYSTGSFGAIVFNDFISGSSTSTGSFGRVEATTFSGDGSGLSNLPASFTAAGISGSWQSYTLVSSSAQIASNISGSVLNPSGNISGSSTSTGSFGKVVGDGSGLTKLQRPITTHTTHFTASMTYAGHYNIVGGELTCSILHPDTASVSIGTEFEFFQTSSAGTMFFETGSTGTTLLMSKGAAVKLTGQYSAATLKKTATNTWHLVGDLA